MWASVLVVELAHPEHFPLTRLGTFVMLELSSREIATNHSIVARNNNHFRFVRFILVALKIPNNFAAE